MVNRAGNFVFLCLNFIGSGRMEILFPAKLAPDPAEFRFTRDQPAHPHFTNKRRQPLTPFVFIFTT
jgi:hypothetical protein